MLMLLVVVEIISDGDAVGSVAIVAMLGQWPIGCDSRAGDSNGNNICNLSQQKRKQR